MQSSAGLDMPTRSGLISLLQQTRTSATLYEAGAKKQGKAFPFMAFARTERRHERLLVDALKRARIAPPSPPKVVIASELSPLLKQALLQEKETLSEAERCLGFIKQRELVDLLMVIKLTSRDEHLPLLKKKAGEAPLHPSKAEIQRLRGR